MLPSEHRRHRRIHHGLAHLACAKPEEVVGWFGAMQAQDYASAKWAVGVRCAELTDAAVEQAVVDRSIVRTWALRSTLHLVAARDVHWLLALIGPVMLARGAAAYRQLGLDAADFAKVQERLHGVLQGGRQLLREELFAELEEGGVDTQGMRGNRILYRAALSGCICSASLRGRQVTYTLLDEWVPHKHLLERDEALGELVRRYFHSHGPSTLRDFAWWSGLSVADARHGIAIAQDGLRKMHVDDLVYWAAEEELPEEAGSPLAHLLPAFDEYFLGYEDRTVALNAQHFGHVMTNNGIFRPTVLVDGEIVGIWSRSVKRDVVTISVRLFRTLKTSEEQALQAAAQRYANFIGANSAVLLS